MAQPLTYRQANPEVPGSRPTGGLVYHILSSSEQDCFLIVRLRSNIKEVLVSAWLLAGYRPFSKGPFNVFM